jgi:chemotaxis protein histidine kinase CheA
MTDDNAHHPDALRLAARADEALDELRRACEEGEPAPAAAGLVDLAEEAGALGLSGVAEALAAIKRAIDSAAEPEGMRPSTLSLVADAVTGARELVESVALGDLRVSLEPDLLSRLLSATDEPDAQSESAPGEKGSSPPEPAAPRRFSASVENVQNLAPPDPNKPLDPAGSAPPPAAAAPDPEAPPAGEGESIGSAPNAFTADAAPPPADPTAEDLPGSAPSPASEAGSIGSAPNAFAADAPPAPTEPAPEDRSAPAAPPAGEADSIGSAPNAFTADIPPAHTETSSERLESAPNDLAEAALDPNQPLDPTGGAALDPNQPLDPTGGASLDPNQPLDPTGGPALDPNQPLDPTDGSASAPPEPASDDDAWGSTPVSLPPEQAELLLFMVSDVRRSMEEIEPILDDARDFSARGESAERLSTIAEEMDKLNGFFSFKSFASLVELISLAAARLADADDAVAPELFIRVRAIANLIDQYCSGLEVGMELSWPLATLRRRMEKLLSGQQLCEELTSWHNGDVERLLELDGVVEGVENPPKPEVETAAPGSRKKTLSAPSSGGSTGGEAREKSVPSIRVNKNAIDTLLDLIRQLVLNKNQIHSLASATTDGRSDAARSENLLAKADEYARLVGLLQQTITETRVQPIGLLLDRYARAVRDAARVADKEIEFVLRGEETHVDKFVLDEIAEALGMILRHTASALIETPEAREAAGKPRAGRIIVSAEDRGSHIAMLIEHDGHAPDRETLIEQAAESGRLSRKKLQAMSDRELSLLQYEAWFVESGVAGVAEAVRALDGTLEIASHAQSGEAIEIALPIKGAVIEAMNVRVGSGVYAIPITSISEIVKINTVELVSIDQTPALRIRNAVHPLIDCQALFGLDGEEPGAVAIVVRVEEDSFALRVDRVIGHQEAVIQQMDASAAGCEGPFLGAAIQDDGTVALVIDVAQIHHDRLQRANTDARSVDAGS